MTEHKDIVSRLIDSPGIPRRRCDIVSGLTAGSYDNMLLPKRRRARSEEEQELVELYLRYGDAVFEHVQRIHLPVSLAVWEQHRRMADAELKGETNPKYRRDIQHEKILRPDPHGQPTLAYDLATEALDSFYRNDPKPAHTQYEVSARYAAINKAEINLANAVWQNSARDASIRRLAVKLYDANQAALGHNIAFSAKDAMTIAGQFAAACDVAKAEVLGLSISKGASR